VPAATWPVPSCGVTLAGNNGAGGSTSTTVSWGACDAFGGYTGPEYAYVWTAPGSASVTVTLSGLGSDDRDLLVFQDTGGGCLVGAMTCVGVSQNGCGFFSCTDEVVAFSASAGATYYFVVDGFAGAVGGYSISMTGCGI